MIEVFLAIIAIIWLIFASISDIKTHEVPNWLTYSLIIIGFSSALLKSILFKNVSFLFYSIFTFGLFFLFSLLLYYTKQWGGGDVKLLAGLVTLFPVYPEELLNYLNPNLNMPFILTLVINIILFGSLYSIIYGVYLMIIKKVKVINEVRKYKLNGVYILTPFLLLILAVLVQDTFLKLIFLAFGILILITPLLLMFSRIVEKKCMIKKIRIKDLREGDWIINNLYAKSKLIYSNKSPGVTNHEINLIKRLKIKTLMVKEGIPFIPTFLIAFLITIIFGSLF